MIEELADEGHARGVGGVVGVVDAQGRVEDQVDRDRVVGHVAVDVSAEVPLDDVVGSDLRLVVGGRAVVCRDVVARELRG